MFTRKSSRSSVSDRGDPGQETNQTKGVLEFPILGSGVAPRGGNKRMKPCNCCMRDSKTDELSGHVCESLKLSHAKLENSRKPLVLRQWARASLNPQKTNIEACSWFLLSRSLKPSKCCILALDLNGRLCLLSSTSRKRKGK